MNLRAAFPGGEALVELEDRNVRPTICLIWSADAPQDGDGITSRILTREGAEVVDCGTGDQWVDGAGEGCEIPEDDRDREVFADPGAGQPAAWCSRRTSSTVSASSAVLSGR